MGFSRNVHMFLRFLKEKLILCFQGACQSAGGLLSLLITTVNKAAGLCLSREEAVCIT